MNRTLTSRQRRSAESGGRRASQHSQLGFRISIAVVTHQSPFVVAWLYKNGDRLSVPALRGGSHGKPHTHDEVLLVKRSLRAVQQCPIQGSKLRPLVRDTLHHDAIVHLPRDRLCNKVLERDHVL